MQLRLAEAKLAIKIIQSTFETTCGRTVTRQLGRGLHMFIIPVCHSFCKVHLRNLASPVPCSTCKSADAAYRSPSASPILLNPTH